MPLPGGLLGKAGHAPRALVLHAAAGSQGQPPPADQRLEVVDQAVVAAVQEKQHGAPDDARAARGALLEDVVVLQPVRPQGLLPHEDAELEGLDVVEVHGAVRRQAREVHPRVGQSAAASRLVGRRGAGMSASCCEGAVSRYAAVMPTTVQSDSGKRERLSATSNFVLMAAIMVPARADGDAGLTIHAASLRK